MVKADKSYTAKRKGILKSSKYKKLRQKVYKLDDYTCVICKQKGGFLEMHHIIRWYDAPVLRYSENNAITVCINCHENSVTGNEAKYADFFRKKVIQRKRRVVAKNMIKLRKVRKRACK